MISGPAGTGLQVPVPVVSGTGGMWYWWYGDLLVVVLSVYLAVLVYT